MDGGYPDGCSAADIPHNSRAAELAEIHWTLVRPQVERQTRADLIACCNVPGRIRNEYLSTVSRDGIMSIPAYVRSLQERDDPVWQRAMQMVYQSQFGGDAA